MLNLCAEFYGAAEELVVSILLKYPRCHLTFRQKSTPPLVVSQCYHMGPNVKVDPLIMLGEAKRVCDTLVSVLIIGLQIELYIYKICSSLQTPPS